MTQQAPAIDWTCGRCEVTASWMVGTERPVLPSGWVQEDESFYCLGCRRERAGDAALDGIPEDAPVELRQKTRHRARVEFEITRDPERPDNKIAKACRTSTPAVRKARERLGVPRV